MAMDAFDFELAGDRTCGLRFRNLSSRTNSARSRHLHLIRSTTTRN